MTMLTTLATHPGPWHDGSAPGYWPIFPIMFGLFWLAVIGTGLYLVRRRTAAHAAASDAASDPMAKAQSLLAERFARGEIDEDEYLMRQSTLRNGG
ncbi:SHOCT domain-containing protein [Actinomadura violacea]|uniref:SHOCT domain-containing protein n=1 Tax=Actinomadura violacea TaxID=2819934 RepID=A0ABS3RV72_9ACTN|nr:hypothetical protein [Actinomadura violacea]MBO2460633.1 hypothetical protein [Actinomadura violacea]